LDQLHPLVRAILEGLLRGPLQFLALEALERLSDGPDGEDPSEGLAENDLEPSKSPTARRAWSEGPKDGLDQLLIVEKVIGARLRREAAIARSLPVLAERLKLNAVLIDGRSQAGRESAVPDRGLLGPGRIEALGDFEAAFRKTIERARSAIGREREEFQ